MNRSEALDKIQTVLTQWASKDPELSLRPKTSETVTLRLTSGVFTCEISFDFRGKNRTTFEDHRGFWEKTTPGVFVSYAISRSLPPLLFEQAIKLYQKALAYALKLEKLCEEVTDFVESHEEAAQKLVTKKAQKIVEAHCKSLRVGNFRDVLASEIESLPEGEYWVNVEAKTFVAVMTKESLTITRTR